MIDTINTRLIEEYRNLKLHRDAQVRGSDVQWSMRITDLYDPSKQIPSVLWNADEDNLLARNKKNLNEIDYKPVSAEEYLKSKGKGKALAAAQKKDADIATGTTPSRPSPPIPRPEGPSRPPVDLTNREKLMERLRGGGEVSATTQASQATGSVVDDAAKAAPTPPTPPPVTPTAPASTGASPVRRGYTRKGPPPKNLRTYGDGPGGRGSAGRRSNLDSGRIISSGQGIKTAKTLPRRAGTKGAQRRRNLSPTPVSAPTPAPTPAPTTSAAPAPVTGTSPNTTVQASQAAGSKAKVGLSEMLKSGKVGRNAMAGAAVGAALGGLNPAGDDGLFRGAMGGAVVGATMGGLAAAINANMNQEGTDMISKGGRFFPPEITNTSTKPGRAGIALSLGGVVGGIMGGLIGGSGKGKRHNTIDSNGWSKGTHPAYF